jgi:hypothetical protein
MTYLGSLMTYFGSLMTYFGSLMTYFGSLMTYFGSLMTYFGSLMNQNRSFKYKFGKLSKFPELVRDLIKILLVIFAPKHCL